LSTTGPRLPPEDRPEPADAVSAVLDVNIANARYRPRATIHPNDSYEAVVLYPGEYEIRRGGTDGSLTGTVAVPGSGVRNGTTARAG